MEKHEDVASILSILDLDDIEETVSQPYHGTGPGRPPRNPLGIFKALIVKRLRRIPSDRELYRRLWNDEALREICEIASEGFKHLTTIKMPNFLPIFINKSYSLLSRARILQHMHTRFHSQIFRRLWVTL